MPLSPQPKDFAADMLPRNPPCLHFIDGAWMPSFNGRFFENFNPATGQVLGLVAEGGSAEVDRAAQAAHRAFEQGDWSKLPVRVRCQTLNRIADLMSDRLEALALAETRDTGKPIAESREGDIPRAIENFRFFAEAAAQLGEACYTVGLNERHFAVREPLGVVGLITPWNLPLYLASWKIAPALAMGNAIILKPAEWTPTTATLLAEIVQEAGLPAGVFNVVHGFGADGAGEALTRHPLVKAISFTGETGTGRSIMRTAADTLKKVSFELGGKGATVLFADADLATAIPTAARAAFRNQGQICLAGSRLFVERPIWETALAGVVAEAQAIRVGDPLQPETRMGSLISEEHLQKVLAYVAQGRAQGRLLTGGERLFSTPGGCFLSPTVLTDLPADNPLCQEEIFGPVLTVTPFDTEGEAVALVNGTPYGLSASVWSRDVDRCHRVAQGIRAGMVWVNCWFARDLRTPFGGMKASGVGREGGRQALDFFSEAKTVSYRYQPG